MIIIYRLFYCCSSRRRRSSHESPLSFCRRCSSCRHCSSRRCRSSCRRRSFCCHFPCCRSSCRRRFSRHRSTHRSLLAVAAPSAIAAPLVALFLPPLLLPHFSLRSPLAIAPLIALLSLLFQPSPLLSPSLSRRRFFAVALLAAAPFAALLAAAPFAVTSLAAFLLLLRLSLCSSCCCSSCRFLLVIALLVVASLAVVLIVASLVVASLPLKQAAPFIGKPGVE